MRECACSCERRFLHCLTRKNTASYLRHRHPYHRTIYKHNCVICGKQELDKDTIGINKKLLGTDIENFYCMECLAEYLECTVDELLDKIEEFKAEGCKLFL